MRKGTQSWHKKPPDNFLFLFLKRNYRRLKVYSFCDLIVSLLIFWVNIFCEWNCKMCERELLMVSMRVKHAVSFLRLSPEKHKFPQFTLSQQRILTTASRKDIRKRKVSSQLCGSNSCIWRISFVWSLHQFGRVFWRLTRFSRWDSLNYWNSAQERTLWTFLWRWLIILWIFSRTQTRALETLSKDRGLPLMDWIFQW